MKWLKYFLKFLWYCWVPIFCFILIDMPGANLGWTIICILTIIIYVGVLINIHMEHTEETCKLKRKLENFKKQYIRGYNFLHDPDVW